MGRHHTSATTAAAAAAAAAALAIMVLAALRLRRHQQQRKPLQPARPQVREPLVISTASAAEAVCEEWLRDIRLGRLASAIGLDAEWVKGQPPALVQLSCGSERPTVLLRLCEMRHEPPPPSLAALLADGAILKAGVGVVADLARLEDALGTPARGGVELGGVLATDGALHAAGLASQGLRQLAAAVLGVQLDKAAAVRCSDWEAAALSDEQVCCARPRLYLHCAGCACRRADATTAAPADELTPRTDRTTAPPLQRPGV